MMNYELEEGEIPPWQNTLNRALERIEQLEAALHTERQSRLQEAASAQRV